MTADAVADAAVTVKSITMKADVAAIMATAAVITIMIADANIIIDGRDFALGKAAG